MKTVTAFVAYDYPSSFDIFLLHYLYSLLSSRFPLFNVFASIYPYGNNSLLVSVIYSLMGGRRGRDRMIVGFTTTYAINAYHHKHCEFESCSGEVYSI